MDLLKINTRVVLFTNRFGPGIGILVCPIRFTFSTLNYSIKACLRLYLYSYCHTFEFKIVSVFWIQQYSSYVKIYLLIHYLE